MAKEPFGTRIKKLNEEQLIDLKANTNEARGGLIDAELEKRSLRRPTGKK